MTENPIKYSDLIQPDDSIEKLVKELDEANDAYNNMAQSIKAQAVSISASLKTISGATESGRASTRAYSQDAEKLLKAERDLNFARTETARKIAELNAMKKDEQTITKLTVQLNRTQEGTYEHLAAQYGLNKIRLNAMTEEYRRNTEEGQKLENETRDIYERMSELQKATGKYTLEVGNYEKAIGQLMGTQNKYIQNLQLLATLFEGGVANAMKMAGQQLAAFGKQLLALLANPIVATIAAIAAAFMALAKVISSSEENTNALNRVLAPFTRILAYGLGLLQDFATFVLKVVEGFENLAMGASRLMERLPLVGNAIKNVNDALQDNIDLEREKQALQKDGRKLTVQEAKTQYEISVLRRKANQTDDPRERAALLQKAVNKENQMSANRVAYIQRELNVLKAKSRQNQNDSAMNDQIAQKEAELWNARTQAEQRNLRLVKQIHNANKQQNAVDTVKADDSVQQAQKIADEKLAIEQKTTQLIIQNLENEFAREYQLIEYNYGVQIQALIKKGNKEKELRSALSQEIVALQRQRDMKLAELTIKLAEKEKAEQEKLKKDKERAAQDVYRTQVDVINQQAKLRQLDIDNMETSEYEKTRLSIQAEKDRLKAIYDINVKSGKDLISLEMQTLRAQMQKVDNELKKASKNRDIFDMLGFNLTDEKKEGIANAFNFAIDQLHAYMDAWVQAAEAKAQLAEKEVDRAQSVLEAEMQARANGYANDVETARKELELAKSNQEKALKQKEEAQKAQLAMQTIEQASNLITASSLIWSQLGFPWAIPALAVMWGSFAAAKIKAAELTKVQNEQYGEGTVELLQGGSHQSGNDIDLGTKSDGTRRRAEGGEYFAVINKRNSRKYRQYIPDLINSLNAGTFERKYLHAYDGAEQVAVSVQGGNSSDLRRLGNDVSAIRQQGERTTYTDARGAHVIYKNLHRIILN
jgi:hypothetical protein